MRKLTVAGEILPVLGTIGLLGLWFYQQTQVEERAAELRKLAAARAVYQTYQSNNALFNALVAGMPEDSRRYAEIRTLQVRNYETGLSAIEEALPEAARAGVPPRDYFSPTKALEQLEGTQRRLEVLQERLSARDSIVRSDADASKRRYLWLYLALSVVSVTGAICKVMDKLSSAAP